MSSASILESFSIGCEFFSQQAGCPKHGKMISVNMIQALFRYLKGDHGPRLQDASQSFRDRTDQQTQPDPHAETTLHLCPLCQGWGRIGGSPDHTINASLQCTYCQGTGQIKAHVMIFDFKVDKRTTHNWGEPLVYMSNGWILCPFYDDEAFQRLCLADAQDEHLTCAKWVDTAYIMELDLHLTDREDPQEWQVQHRPSDRLPRPNSKGDTR
jgi:hypothetical protein